MLDGRLHGQPLDLPHHTLGPAYEQPGGFAGPLRERRLTRASSACCPRAMKDAEGYREPVALDERELDTVVIERTADPMRAAMVRAILEGEDIVVSTPGYHVATMTGLSGSFDISVRVPKVDVDRARAALAERGALSSKITVETPRRWRAAAMVALIPGFGAGHLYAGAYLSAAMFAVADVLTLVAVVRGSALHAAVAFFIPRIADALGSRAATQRANDKKPMRTWLSPAAMIGPTLVCLYLFVMTTYAPTLLARPDGRAVCAYNARCAGDDEAACLLAFARAHADGWEGYSDRCVRCMEENPTCESHSACDVHCGE